ncbi:hypothetical protein AMC87_CH00643 [Rhizobium phaseoli]|nr:hypothetical protein AMC87_CH00643 [Rhizobium phaseoli]
MAVIAAASRQSPQESTSPPLGPAALHPAAGHQVFSTPDGNSCAERSLPRRRNKAGRPGRPLSVAGHPGPDHSGLIRNNAPSHQVYAHKNIAEYLDSLQLKSWQDSTAVVLAGAAN